MTQLMPGLAPYEQRAAVVAAARKWIGTPFHDGADVIDVGVDCGMLIVRVFVDLGLVAPFDPRPYPPDWMIHRGPDHYLTWLAATAREVLTPKPGDIAVFRYGRCMGHGGIVSEPAPDLRLVHAYADWRMVVEDSFTQNPQLTKRETRFFSIWKDD